MSTQFPTYTYHNKLNSNTLFVILHGGGAGIEDPFLGKIYDKIISANQSYLAIQMSFIDRVESSSSGLETPREIEEVQTVLDQINLSNYTDIHFIGKSLGGLVLQRFITQSPVFNALKTNLTVLGYLVGDVDISQFQGSLHIIQGEYDPYGTPEAVQKDLDLSPNTSAKLDIIPNGDHSYRNDKKEPIYQDEAVGLIQI
jgi:predicted alpha/beta-hydrolase family hydrolase